jgi:nicotinate-nucleotide adenylyltransferase
MGADNLRHFHKWKNHEEILDKYQIYVYPRLLDEDVELPLLHHPKVSLYQAPIMKISSSFIRQSIEDKKDVRHYLPKDVFEYISEMHFYEKRV